MLGNAPIIATLPIVNVERARGFYENVLGLQVAEILDSGMVMYACGDGTMFGLYQRPTPTAADHTVVSWRVGNIDEEVEGLVAKGVTFEQYDIPEMSLKTDDRGIADLGSSRGAWFKDPAGNILSIFQM